MHSLSNNWLYFELQIEKKCTERIASVHLHFFVVDQKMHMCLLILTILLSGRFIDVGSSMILVGNITNVFLQIFPSNTTIVSGNKQQCLCLLTPNTSLYFGFNYINANFTCQMHLKSDQNRSFALVDDTTSVFYFLSFPTYTAPWPTTRTITQVTSTAIGKMSGNYSLYELPID